MTAEGYAVIVYLFFCVVSAFFIRRSFKIWWPIFKIEEYKRTRIEDSIMLAHGWVLFVCVVIFAVCFLLFIVEGIPDLLFR